MERFILASASLQRRELLLGLGLTFEVVPCQLSESEVLEREPKMRAIALAKYKAEDIAKKFPIPFVLGCDTLVVSPNGELFEKPQDATHAREMLSKQSGGVSIVHSALCLVTPQGIMHEGVDSSAVHFKNLTESDLDWWISTGLWKDRSGSFQIDGPGQLLIERIEGDWSGIVGLPVYLFGVLSKKAGLNVQTL